MYQVPISYRTVLLQHTYTLSLSLFLSLSFCLLLSLFLSVSLSVFTSLYFTYYLHTLPPLVCSSLLVSSLDRSLGSLSPFVQLTLYSCLKYFSIVCIAFYYVKFKGCLSCDLLLL
uniref:Uncharacterized protein n=1 Tax=Anopheles darlingi TaxID=43151 RepID=A0A2M4CW68_ANODA